MTDQRLSCSFCGQAHDEVLRLFAGARGALVCNECVAMLARDLTENEKAGMKPALNVKREPITIRWDHLPHHQTHGKR